MQKCRCDDRKEDCKVGSFVVYKNKNFSAQMSKTVMKMLINSRINKVTDFTSLLYQVYHYIFRLFEKHKQLEENQKVTDELKQKMSDLDEYISDLKSDLADKIAGIEK